MCLWAEEEAWCRWLAPVMPLERFSACPEPYYPLLSQWGLRLSCPLLQALHYTPGSLQRAATPDGWRFVLTLHEGERQLALSIESACWSSWQQATQQWQLQTHNHTSMPLTLPLALGVTTLSGQQLAALRCGDGLVLQHSAAIADGGLWLYQQGVWAEMTLEQQQDLRVTQAYEEPVMRPGTGDVQASGMAAIPLTVVAEVGRVTLTLAQLTTLSAGQLLEGRVAMESSVRLTINGACIGYGSLLRAREHWLIRVDRLLGSPATAEC
ncbi:type III secretion system protein [Serratia quinivorans]|nr:type III secretion system protein [Serratia quinivorans]CAI1809178.1 type III secretion system protein [Serratia quinivorans]